MAYLNDYATNLEYIQQMYTILLDDYTARLNNETTTHAPTDLAQTMKGFGMVGDRLKIMFEKLAVPPSRLSLPQLPSHPKVGVFACFHHPPGDETDINTFGGLGDHRHLHQTTFGKASFGKASAGERKYDNTTAPADAQEYYPDLTSAADWLTFFEEHSDQMGTFDRIHFEWAMLEVLQRIEPFLAAYLLLKPGGTLTIDGFGVGTHRAGWYRIATNKDWYKTLAKPTDIKQVQRAVEMEKLQSFYPEVGTLETLLQLVPLKEISLVTPFADAGQPRYKRSDLRQNLSTGERTVIELRESLEAYYGNSRTLQNLSTEERAAIERNLKQFFGFLGFDPDSLKLHFNERSDINGREGQYWIEIKKAA